jgi:hypothetical protein
LDIADSTGTAGDTAIENGTPSMSGDNIQLPVASDSTTQGTQNALRYEFALPSGLGDGTGGQLLTRLTWDSAPSGVWQVTLGIHVDTNATGVSAGIGHNGTGPFAVTQSLTVLGAAGSAYAGLVATGAVSMAGDWDGVNTVDAQATSIQGSGTSTLARSVTARSTYNVSNANMVLCINDRNGATTETLSIKVEYMVV